MSDATKVIFALHKAGANFGRIDLREPVHSVADVQKACDCETGSVLKALLVVGTGPILCVVPGDKRLDLAKVGSRCGEKGLRFATKQEVSSFMGQEVGAVSPFGVPSSVRLLADEAVRSLDVIVGGSGTETVLIKMAGGEFCRVFGGEFASITL